MQRGIVRKLPSNRGMGRERKEINKVFYGGGVVGKWKERGNAIIKLEKI